MDITFYSSPSQAVIVIPECFLQSSEAHQLYGPLLRYRNIKLVVPECFLLSSDTPQLYSSLVLYKNINVEPNKCATWHKIAIQIDLLSYAVIDFKEMAQLMSHAKAA